MSEKLGKKLIRLEARLNTAQTAKYRAGSEAEKQKKQKEISALQAEIRYVKEQILKA